ncbi:MAG: glucodextranase DOMON-like domain-containing protein [Thermoplasmatales archaeon]
MVASPANASTYTGTQNTVPMNYGTIIFTGNVSHDFPGSDLVYLNKNTSAWGSENNISAFYVSYNATYVFFGFSAQYQDNGFMLFISNNTGSGLGTYNFTNLNQWKRNIIFSRPVNAFFANFAGGPSQSYVITSGLSSSNTSPFATEISNINYYGPASVEVALPLADIFENATGNVTMSVNAFIVGGSGSWVGTGIPFAQEGKYNSGNTIAYFVANNFITLSLHYSKIVVPQVGKINVDIIYNDHQPLYSPVNSTYWFLPWVDVHLAEYAEQAIIMSRGYNVNVTYSLSGSLLLQIDAVMQGNYNNSYIMAAFIPQAQWNNTVYTEIHEYNDTFLESFVQSFAYNTTTVRDILEFNLSFNSPSWVYSSGTPAGAEYARLLAIESTGKIMNNSDLTNALVEFFLWSVSYPIISGQLGAQYKNVTLMSLYNDTSFQISDISKIIRYYPVEASIAINAFRSDARRGNVELITTPFDHPILPLLLQSNWTDANGIDVYKGSWGNDVAAQINIGRDIFYNNFGYYPDGQWTPEQAVSNAIVPYLYKGGVVWTATDQAVLQEAGVLNSNMNSSTFMQTLYKPYEVSENGSTLFVVFRDSTLSNDWAFNYGNIANQDGNWAAVSQFMSYLKGVYDTVPVSERNNTIVTVALDGENWMFMSPFPEDGVPFLEDLYTAIQQNSSWLNSVTMQQYLSSSHIYGNLSYLPTGSWNYQGYSGSVSPYLTQWAGHPTQDQIWVQLAEVRKMVLEYGTANDLVQPVNLSNFSDVIYYPSLGIFNLSSLQQKYDVAWLSIYAAEGSDYYFSFDPGDQNLYSQNDIAFSHEVRLDMVNALKVLGLPLTPYLLDTWESPITPSVWGSNQSVTPPMNGNIMRTHVFPYGTGYSISNNSAWSSSYLYNYTTERGNVTVRYEFNSTDIFLLISGTPLKPRLMENGKIAIQIYFSNVNPGKGTLVGLGVPGAELETSNGQLLHFASEFYAVPDYSCGMGDQYPLLLYQASNGTWRFDAQTGISVINEYAEFMIPYSALGLRAQNSILFSVNIIEHSMPLGLLGPMEINIPTNALKFTLISSISNPLPSNGPGNYVYPTNTNDYPPNSVWMKHLNVSESSSYVEFSIFFGNLSNVFGGPYGFSQPIIDIYVHTSNFSNGNTAMLPGPNACVTKAFDWQWVIQAAGFPENSYIQNYTGFQNNTGYFITSNLTTKVVNIYVPLGTIGYNVTNYGYVIVAGIQDGYATNGWDPVYASPTEYQGGGANGPFAPNIFSYISPYDINGNISQSQEAILSTYTASSYASLPGIYLPLLSQLQVRSQQPMQKFPSVLRSANLYQAFYYFEGNIYTTQSNDGYVWSTPQIFTSWGPNVTGISAIKEYGNFLILITGNYRYSVFSQEGLVLNNTAPSRIFSSTIVSVMGVPFIFLQLKGSVEIFSLYGKQVGTITGNMSNISASSRGPLVFLSYVSGNNVSVDVFLFYPFFYNISQLTYTAQFSGNITSIGVTSVYAFSPSRIIVAVQVRDSEGTNIYMVQFANGGRYIISNITSNGFSLYPDLVSTGLSGVAPGIAFVSLFNQWNVYFIKSPSS